MTPSITGIITSTEKLIAIVAANYAEIGKCTTKLALVRRGCGDIQLRLPSQVEVMTLNGRQKWQAGKRR
jgi:hypothetical protein